MSNVKNKKILIILIIAGVILFMFLLLYKKEDKVNNSIKKDPDKDFVYDADYNLKVDVESYFGYSDKSEEIKASDIVVPYVNINTTDAKSVNDEIYKLYENLINEYNENAKEGISFTRVDYNVITEKDKYISIIITTSAEGTDVPFINYYVYSFDYKTGNLIKLKDAIKDSKLTEEEFKNLAQESIENYIKEYYNFDLNYKTEYRDKPQTALEASKDEFLENYDKNNIKFYLDKDGIYIISKIYFPAGRSEALHILKISAS